MDLLLFLLRCLFGLPSDETMRMQPIRVHKGGRYSCRRSTFASFLWIPGIGWLTLPERFSHDEDSQSWTGGKWVGSKLLPSLKMDDWRSRPEQREVERI